MLFLKCYLGQFSKNCWNLYPKNFQYALKYMGLGSGIRDPGSGKNPFRIPDPEVKKAPDPGSWIRIRNTAINSQSCINQSFSVFYACWWKDPELEPEPCKPKTYGSTEHWAKHFGLLFSPLPRFSSGMKTCAPATHALSTVMKVNTCSTFSTSSSQTKQEINLHVGYQLPY